MIVWAIKRNDGRYYTGKGEKTWRGDPSWKVELHSAGLYTEVYLKKAIDRAIFRIRNTDYSIKPVKVKIEEVK